MKVLLKIPNTPHYHDSSHAVIAAATSKFRMSFSPDLPQPRPRQRQRKQQVRPSLPQDAKVADNVCEHGQEQHAQRAFLMTARASTAPTTHAMPRRRRRRRRKTRPLPNTTSTTLLTVLAAISILPNVVAQTTCIPLTGSSACPAFASSSIATTPYLVGLLYVLSSCSSSWFAC